MTYLLDTDVVSQRIKKQPVQAVMNWLRNISETDLRLSAITVHEIRAGAESMPHGHKRREVEAWLERDILTAFSDRILPVDFAVADLCGRITVDAMKRGHTPSLDDALTAATARAHGLKLATLNRRHFEWLGVELVDF